MFDNHPNLASGTVLVAPTPALSGNTITLLPDEGDVFQPNMPVTLYPADLGPTAATAEIGYLTAVVGDVLTVTRAQEGTSAQAVVAGWKVIGAVTRKTIKDVEDAVLTKAPAADLAAHVSNVSNPHAVTKAQVGLGNTDNTSDLNKPVSTAMQTALNAKADQSSLTAHVSNVSNPHAVTKAQVGLGNVDNTSDIGKPVSSATQTALNLKADLTYVDSKTTDYATLLNKPVIGGSPSMLLSRPDGLQMITTFAAGHSWISTGTYTSVNLNDTTDYILGSQSANVVTDGAGGYARVRKTDFSPMNLSGKEILIWVKVDDITHLSELTFHLYMGGGTSNYYTWIIYPTLFTAYENTHVKSGAPVLLKLNVGSIRGSGGTLDITNVTGAEFKTKDNGTGTIKAHFYGVATAPIRTNPYPNGVVSITFDDGYDSQYNLARPIMDAAGMAGVAYIIKDRIDTAGFMTLDNLKNLQNLNGWDISGHAYSTSVHDAGMINVAPSVLRDDLEHLSQWLEVNGLYGGGHLAYPRGQYNTQVKEMLSNYFVTGRSIDDALAESQRPADMYSLQSLSTVGYGSASATYVNQRIDKAVANGEWLVLCFHKIVTGTAASTLECSVTDFQSIVSHLAASGAAVRTVSQVLNDGTNDSTAVRLTGDQTISGNKTFGGTTTLGAVVQTDGTNVALGSTTGTKIGTSASQKLAFLGATPIVQQAAATDLGTVLGNLGLRAVGASYGITTSGSVVLSGRYAHTPLVRNANVTLTTNSQLWNPCNATGGAFTITLPAANGASGQQLTFKKTDATANLVTIAAAGTDKIDGAASYLGLSAQYKFVTLTNDANSNWYIIGAN